MLPFLVVSPLVASANTTNRITENKEPSPQLQRPAPAAQRLQGKEVISHHSHTPTVFHNQENECNGHSHQINAMDQALLVRYEMIRHAQLQQLSMAPASYHPEPLQAIDPPSHQQWLITNGEWHAHEGIFLQEMTSKWRKAAPCPQTTDRQAKLDWLTRFGQVAAKDEMQLHYSLTKLKAKAAGMALFEVAPEEITLELFCPWENLESLYAVDNAALQETLARYKPQQTHSLVDDSAPKTHILLASAVCKKADGFKCMVEALARSFDLDVHFASLQGSADVPDFFGINPKIGENLCFKKSGGLVILPILGRFSPRSEWSKELEEIKKQTAIDGTAAKDFVLVDKPCIQHRPDASHPPVPTKDTHLCLWLPADFPSVLERVRNHILLGDGECMSIQLRLQSHDQIAASLTLAMFEQELHFIKKKIRRWSFKFTRALALTMVVTEDLRWMRAAGSVKAVSAAMNKLSHYWRVTLLQKSDTELFRFDDM